MKKNYLHPYAEPPYTNRGVERTWSSGLRACVDWCSVTFNDVTILSLIEDVLQMHSDDFFDSTGMHGYRRSKKCGSISIYYDGREDMGIHLEMKGRGCREYERLGKRTWKELFQTIFEYQGSFTRLDPAVDDFDGIFTIKNLVKRVKKDTLVSKFHRARNFEDIIINGGEVRGVTLKFGSDKSNIQVIMYDKLSERKDTNYNVSEDIKVWNRTELRLRDEKAEEVARILAYEEDGEESIGKTVCGILKSLLRFVDQGKSKDTNKRRWKNARFWDKFLGKVEALPLTTIIEEKTVLDKVEWLRHQGGPTLAMIVETYGDEAMDMLRKMAEESKPRLKAKDYNMIRKCKEDIKKTSIASETMKVAEK
ncbi:replication initiation factor domain-containing protein [Bacillus cereus]|uniref:replication initiation factor domain-containing protein n=1 Tax=Bacillus paranthracis TaxID=2026186 RepID=UPI002A0547D6|nr:replication initiation factor domain-containing protein [Bacillus cereus]